MSARTTGHEDRPAAFWFVFGRTKMNDERPVHSTSTEKAQPKQEKRALSLADRRGFSQPGIPSAAAVRSFDRLSSISLTEASFAHGFVFGLQKGTAITVEVPHVEAL